MSESLHDLRNFVQSISAENELYFSRMRAHIQACIRWIDRNDPDHKHGLEIVNECVDQLNGEFPPLEQNPGHGATATVFLPAKRLSGIQEMGECFNLNLAVSNFADGFPTRAGIKLEVRLNAEEDLWICGKESDLEKILLNLCFNARNAIMAAKREHGLILIAVGSSAALEQTAVLKVVDNGTGLLKRYW